MPVPSRPRRLLTAALPAVAAVALTACNASYPNSIFHANTEFNRDVGTLFSILIWLGTAVFIFVEAILVWTLIKYRARPGQAEPEHVHGNTTLEIAWTRVVFERRTIAGDVIVPFVTEGHEGFDINDPYDWMVAERLLAEGAVALPPVPQAPYQAVVRAG